MTTPATPAAAPAITTVNYHLWKPCNMRCHFCFATFADIPTAVLPKGHLTREESSRLVSAFAQAGFREINFAGGEPMLCPWLPDLIRQAHRLGIVTSMVTNASRLTPAWLDNLDGSLDYATVSVDSISAETLIKSGRATPAGPMTGEQYAAAIRMLQDRGIRTKVNTVLNSSNVNEDITDFIIDARPDRWKILQVLPVAGQNDGSVEPFIVSTEAFAEYIHHARRVESHGVRIVAEDNDLTTGSYVMVDPAGRFFDNTAGAHTYSDPILEVGVTAALRQLCVDPGKFIARDGFYNTANRTIPPARR